jgi:hypothetical protein
MTGAAACGDTTIVVLPVSARHGVWHINTHNPMAAISLTMRDGYMAPSLPRPSNVQRVCGSLTLIDPNLQSVKHPLDAFTPKR